MRRKTLARNFASNAATVSFLAIVLAGCAQTQVSVKVSKYPKAPMTDSVLDTTLKQGSSSLIIDPGHAHCGLQLELDSKKSQASSLGRATVHGTGDFQRACAPGVTINIVRNIEACSDNDVTNGTILGCTVGDCAVVVWEEDSVDNASLLLHEYGHVKGLVHIDADRYLMRPVLDDDQYELPDYQCHEIKGQPDEDKKTPPSPQSDSLSPKEFVSRQYIHGLPLDDARKFKGQDLREIRDMLKDSKYQRYWPNIVMVLGVAGEESDAQALVSFLERKAIKGEHSYRAKIAVPAALSYLAPHIAPTNGKDYLKGGADPDFWKKKKIRLSADDSVDESAEELAKTSILAIGVVQQPDVHEFLEKLKLDKRQFFKDNLPLIQRSINMNNQK